MKFKVKANKRLATCSPLYIMEQQIILNGNKKVGEIH